MVAHARAPARAVAKVARQVVVVDTETTGLGHNARPPRPDGVIQIGYAWRTPLARSFDGPHYATRASPT
jgi:hypothetical protein